MYKDEDQDDDPKWLPFTRGALKVKNLFEISEDYLKDLNDVGVNLTHPSVSNLTLEDIFIYPRLEKINFIEKKR